MNRSKTDKARQALYDTYQALPNLNFDSEWRYGQVAFALNNTTNPQSALSGVVVYNVERIKDTPKCTFIWAFEMVWKKGKGKYPNFPYRVNKRKHSNVKLIAKELN